MFCPNCGNQIPDGSEFCPACGVNLGVRSNSPVNSNNISQLFNNTVENIKKFATGPKRFISEFLSSENYDKRMPFIFIICEVALTLLFSFICINSFKGLVNYYIVQTANFSGGLSGTMKSQADFAMKTLFDGTFITIFIWSFVIITVIWLCRFAISKMTASPANQNRVFALLSVFSIIHIVQWLFNILYVIIIFNSLKFDLRTLSSQFSGYSSSNPMAVLQVYQDILGRFNGVMRISTIFNIIATLLYTIDVFAVKRTMDELQLTDALPTKKATIIIIVFAIILIYINNNSVMFVARKVFEKIITNTTTLGALGIMS